MGDFIGPVLMIHGNEDQTASFRLSKKAFSRYKNGVFYVVNGGGHGMFDTYFSFFSDYVYDFLEDNELLAR